MNLSAIKKAANGWTVRLAETSDRLLFCEPVVAVAVSAALLFSLHYRGGQGNWGLLALLLPLPVARWIRGGFRFTLFDLPIALVLAGSLWGLRVSPNPSVSLSGLQTLLAAAALYYALANYPPRWMMQMTILSLATIALGALWAFVPTIAAWGSWGETVSHLRRALESTRQFFMQKGIKGFFSHGTGTSVAVVVNVLPLAGGALFAKRLSIRLPAAALALFGFFLLLWSPSKGAWLAAMAGLLFLLVGRSRWFLLALPAAAAIVLWSITIRMGYPLSRTWPIMERLWQVRLEIWGWALQKLAEHPFVGAGLGTLRVPPSSNTHNAYFQLYADAGILGGIAFLLAAIIFLWWLYRLYRNRRHPWYGWGLALSAAVVAVGLYGIFETSPMGYAATKVARPYYAVTPFFWILGGLLEQCRRAMEIRPQA